MKFQFVFGFILLILFFIAIFVGLPYLLQTFKSNQFFHFPRLTPVSTSPNYFFNKPASPPQTYQPAPTIKPGGSIYKGKITISNVYYYGQGQINLSAAYSEGGSIDITGWKIVSAQRGETIIGRGLALPQFSPFSSDIRLKSGGSAKIIAGLSPLLSNFQIK